MANAPLTPADATVAEQIDAALKASLANILPLATAGMSLPDLLAMAFLDGMSAGVSQGVAIGKRMKKENEA